MNRAFKTRNPKKPGFLKVSPPRGPFRLKTSLDVNDSSASAAELFTVDVRNPNWRHSQSLSNINTTRKVSEHPKLTSQRKSVKSVKSVKRTKSKKTPYRRSAKAPADGNLESSSMLETPLTLYNLEPGNFDAKNAVFIVPDESDMDIPSTSKEAYKQRQRPMETDSAYFADGEESQECVESGICSDCIQTKSQMKSLLGPNVTPSEIQIILQYRFEKANF